MQRDSRQEYVADTTLDQVGAYLRLYHPGGGTLVKNPEDLYVSLSRTPVNYYLNYNVDTLTYAMLFDYNYLFPVYERYFDTPAKVADTLYVGVSNKMFQRDATDSTDTAAYAHHSVQTVYFFDQAAEFDKPAIAIQWADSTWRFFPQPPYRLFLFPILTPGENLPDIDDSTYNPIDTSIVDTTQTDTTLGISMRMLQRYTTLLPNPATERVQVLSSFGLSRIELYNAAGVRVHEQKTTASPSTSAPSPQAPTSSALPPPPAPSPGNSSSSAADPRRRVPTCEKTHIHRRHCRDATLSGKIYKIYGFRERAARAGDTKTLPALRAKMTISFQPTPQFYYLQHESHPTMIQSRRLQ